TVVGHRATTTVPEELLRRQRDIGQRTERQVLSQHYVEQHQATVIAHGAAVVGGLAALQGYFLQRQRAAGKDLEQPVVHPATDEGALGACAPDVGRAADFQIANGFVLAVDGNALPIDR